MSWKDKLSDIVEFKLGVNSSYKISCINSFIIEKLFQIIHNINGILFYKK